MKRFLALTLSALLLCPITTFGAQTEEAKAVYQEMMEKSQTTTELHAYYDMTIQMKSDMFTELGLDSMDMRIEMDTRIKNVTDPSQMQLSTFSRMSMLGSQQLEYSTYYAGGYYYMDMLGQKLKAPMDVTTAMEDAMSSVNMFETSTDYFKDLTLRTEGDMRILSYTLDDTKMNEMIELVLGTAGMNSLYDGASVSVSNISGEYNIRPDGFYTKATMKMDMTMTMMDETIYASIIADIGVVDPSQPVVINVPNLAEYVEQPLP